MAELAHVRRVRDDLRTEAVDLKAALDHYRSQAREASDTLAAASSGPLMSLDLPEFIDDDVVLAGISSSVGEVQQGDDDEQVEHDTEADIDEADDATYLRAVDDEMMTLAKNWPRSSPLTLISPTMTLMATTVDDTADSDQDGDGFGGTFLAEVRAACRRRRPFARTRE